MTSLRSTLLLAGLACVSVCACSDDETPSPATDAGRVQTDESDEPSTPMDPDGSSDPATTDTAASSLQTDATAVSQAETNSTVLEDVGVSDNTPDAEAEGPSLDGGTDSGVAPPIDDDAGDASRDADIEMDANLEPAEFLAPRGPCATAYRIGRFIIESQEDFGVVQGTFSDAVVPTSVPDVVANDGTCRLDMRRTLTCLPACQSGETCGEDGACIAYPSRLSVGQVEITGLIKPTELAPQNPGFIYLATGVNNPPYLPGSEIILTAAGNGEIPRFDLFGVGSTPLSQDPSWVIEEGEDLVVTWPSSGGNAETTVLVELTIDQHGTSPLSLNCEFPDTGSGSVPSDFIDEMLSSGVSGFPNGRIIRRTADHVDVPLGCFELAIGSPRSASVTVAGHTPCNDTDDCPDGQICNIAIEQCE